MQRIAALTSPAAACATIGTPAETQTSVRVLRQFRVVFKAVKAHFQRVEARTGIGGAQLWAMSIVRSRPGLGVNDLARAMDIHQSTASNLVRLLVERGLLEVVRNGRDRRLAELKLLPAGRALLRRAPGPFAGVLPQALAALDAGTLARLERDLDRLIGALGVSRRAGNTPLAEM